MGTNRGKQFEDVIKNAFLDVENTSVYRLQDSMGGYGGVANICDFIIYHYPTQYFIECKSHYGNTFPLSCITDKQFNGMLEMSAIRGVVAGIIVWFIDKDVTYFKDIRDIKKLKDNGVKSLRFDDTDVIPIEGTKKRVLFSYNMDKFFDSEY